MCFIIQTNPGRRAVYGTSSRGYHGNLKVRSHSAASLPALLMSGITAGEL